MVFPQERRSRSRVLDCNIFCSVFMRVVPLRMHKVKVIEGISDFNAFEDAVQNYWAKAGGINTILTRNIKGFPRVSWRSLLLQSFGSYWEIKLKIVFKILCLRQNLNAMTQRPPSLLLVQNQDFKKLCLLCGFAFPNNADTYF